MIKNNISHFAETVNFFMYTMHKKYVNNLMKTQILSVIHILFTEYQHFEFYM